MNPLIYTTLFCLTYIAYVNAYIITVDADAEECFFEKATEAGTKLGKFKHNVNYTI